ncbi:pyrimidine 5'-nucleotidase [Chitinimonas sp. BJYL2]|uniref:pyrimidine 5'-nucleotidase n=1 Tax=Chitinimonas sp. BJYL2 TaxID=2976696 RepID=UPI0022B5570D|nr:pyrimidine 5'-nucleotidase [Chitinimonas sp. BJYL2]
MHPTWIFDLDNTLHDADPFVFPEINRQMTAYIMHNLGVDKPEADYLRQHFLETRGSTLAGLVRRGVDPTHFLAETHRFPSLEHQLTPMQSLKRSLNQLHGRKLLFTNGPAAYAERVLRGLGIRHHFTALLAIEHTRIRPKPHPFGYRTLLARHRLRPHHCIMVDDTHANLRTAKRLGMRTVWIGPHAVRDPFADLTIDVLADLPRAARRMGWLS